jgi:hypothetical protein
VAKYNLVQIVFDRERLSPDEDVAVITNHIRETIQGAPDIVDVTDQGRANYVQRIGNWWTSVAPHVSEFLDLLEARFYEVPATHGPPMGDPVLVHHFGVTGQAVSSALPPQCATSVTLKTDKRLSWGRYYVPGVVQASTDGKGRLTNATAQDLLTGTHVLTDRSQTGAALTVFSRKEWTHHDPQTIQVDDIVDVIRSRRFSVPHFRVTLSAG